MTHDELLAKIDRKIELWEDLKKQTKTAGWYEPNDSYGVYCSAKALRAVVELHKPINNPNFPDSDRWCWQCAEGRGYAKYPCPTIQAIEKELG